MSEIKLDDANDSWCKWDGHGRVGFVESIQDRTLETAAKKILESPLGPLASSNVARDIRSLKNAQPEPEVDTEHAAIMDEIAGHLRHISRLFEKLNTIPTESP